MSQAIDVLVDGRPIPVPPGWRISVTLERVAGAEVSAEQSELERQRDRTTDGVTHGRRAATVRARHDAVARQYDRAGINDQVAQQGGRRPAGTELEPGVDEVDPLPTMRGRRALTGKPAKHGKLCPSCNLRVGTRTVTCLCGHDFEKAKQAAVA